MDSKDQRPKYRKLLKAALAAQASIGAAPEIHIRWL